MRIPGSELLHTRLRRQVGMSQVGHADSKMTLDVYAQLEQRADRTHGTSFDALLRRGPDARRGCLGNDWAAWQSGHGRRGIYRHGIADRQACFGLPAWGACPQQG